MAGEDGHPEDHSTPKTVRVERPKLRVRKDYLRYMIWISELWREHFVLQNTDKCAERFMKMV